MVKIVVKDIPPSNNKFMGNSASFRIYAAEKTRWFNLIRAALSPGQIPDKPYEKAEVIISYYFKDKRRRDPDNYSGKFILDPLVTLKILKDDNFEVITLKLQAGYDKEDPRTEISIINK